MENRISSKEIKGVLYQCLNCRIDVVQTFGIKSANGFTETRRVTTPNGKKPCPRSADGKHFIHGF